MHFTPPRLAAALSTVALLAGAAVPALAAPVKNVVLVHGAFADASGWKPVYDILTRDGYNVNLVQEPMTSLEDDVAATMRILTRQQGPSILVGHSYGGAVITQAGNASQVAGLVYIAAHAPDTGESPASNRAKMPGATRAIGATADGYLFLDPAHFHEDFAADLPSDLAEFMARSQMPASVKAMTTPITTPAWRVKPSWYMVAREDRTINPDLERKYAARAHSHVVEVSGSHAIFYSRAKEVAALIEEAAQSVDN
jgi:pimeloyl-ACP methyl ester carboxylesterase